MTPRFKDTITLLNRRAAEDGPDGLDTWKSTVLTGCVWAKTAVRSVNGTETSLGESVTVRIPEDGYRAYAEWKGNMAGFTASAGDIVLLGAVRETVTPETVLAVAAAHESMVVRSVRDNTGLPLGHIRLEGV